MGKKVYLTSKQKNKLINAPENGMGYHTVDIVLRDGSSLKSRTVLNCEVLMLEEGEDIKQKDIADVII